MAQKIPIQYRKHKASKPGNILKFTDGSTKLVTSHGNLVNLVMDRNGKWQKPIKLSKKQRIKMRRVQ